MKRVKLDDLEENNEYVAIFDGKPFTGIGCETQEDGMLLELVYDRGVFTVSRRLYPNGELESEIPIAANRSHGIAHQWYQSGKQKRESEFHLGTLVKETLWDENGNIIKQG